MKLSEAMKAGIQFYPVQCKRAFSVEQRNAACALGTAWAGKKGRDDMDMHFLESGKIVDEWSFLDDIAVQQYESLEYEQPDEINFYTVILWLNDQYDWTREQIADWLETLGL